MNENTLLAIAEVLSNNGASRELIASTLREAQGSHPQRKLTREEYDIYAGAIARAVDIMPAFRDAIALIRPFKDHSAPTLYTDKYSRVGIGELFFLPSVSPHRRASLLLHEAMHVLNNHFTRYVEFSSDIERDGEAKDLEINSLLNRHPKVDLSGLLLPSLPSFKLPELRSYEQYMGLMRDRGMLKDENETPQPQAGGDEEDTQEPEGENSSSESSSSEDLGEDENSVGATGESSGDVDSDNEEESDGESSESASSGGAGGSGDESPSEEEGSTSGQSGAGGGLETEQHEGDSSEGSNTDSNSSSSGSSSSNSSSSSSEGELDPEALAEQAADNAEKNSDSSSSGSSCDHATEEREEAADRLNIEKASSTEQAVARTNTAIRVREEAEKARGRGDSGALQMLERMELAMQPSKVDWRVIFRNILSRSRDSFILGRSEHTYRRVNKRLSTGQYIFPGMVHYEPKVTMAVDTSGSMSKKDFLVTLSEMEAIVKNVLRTKDSFRAFCVDAKASEPQPVKSVKELDLYGGGGTRMDIAIESVNLLPRRSAPDLLIVATDGGTDWGDFKKTLLKSKHKFKTIILLSNTMYYAEAKRRLEGLAEVISVAD